MATKITWNLANFKWNNNPHTWEEVLLVEEVLKAVTTGSDIERSLDALTPDKRSDL
jgi:hypothetical protein